MTDSAAAGRPRIRTGDALLALVVAGAMSLSTADMPGGEGVDVLGHALLLAGGATLVLHAVLPRTTMLVTAGFHMTYLVLGYPEGLEWLGTAVALGSTTRTLGLRWGAGVGVLLLGSHLTGSLIRSGQGPDRETVIIVLGVSCAIAVGQWLRTRDAYLVAVRQRADALQRTRADEAQRMVDEERLRIAREVHDVVAHAIASINVQAGVGVHVGERDPARAREALETIRRASGDALADLRSVLGMLRLQDADHPVPRRGVADVGGLLDQARAAGLSAQLDVVGTAVDLPSAVDVAAYRIIQEAVTNTIRHATATTVRVVIRYGGRSLALEVRDDGTGGQGDDGAADPAPGHGLQGMRERVGLLGGRVAAGPDPAGGFVVRADLPLRADVGRAS